MTLSSFMLLLSVFGTESCSINFPVDFFTIQAYFCTKV